MKIKQTGHTVKFSAFYKGHNFYDFLFAFLHTKPLLKWVLSKKKESAPLGSRFFLFRGNPFQKRGKAIWIELPPLKAYPFLLKTVVYILSPAIGGVLVFPTGCLCPSIVQIYIGTGFRPRLMWLSVYFTGSVGAKVSCILSHQGIQLILGYSWASPAILVAGKGREGMFLFLQFHHFHSCSSFFPVPLFHLFYLFSPFFWETTQNDPQGLMCH